MVCVTKKTKQNKIMRQKHFLNFLFKLSFVLSLGKNSLGAREQKYSTALCF